MGKNWSAEYFDGKTHYYNCSICGAWTKHNGGFELTYKIPYGSEGFVRIGFCIECGKEYAKTMIDYAENIPIRKIATREKYREQTKRIEEKSNGLIMRIEKEYQKQQEQRT